MFFILICIFIIQNESNYFLNKMLNTYYLNSNKKDIYYYNLHDSRGKNGVQNLKPGTKRKKN